MSNSQIKIKLIFALDDLFRINPKNTDFIVLPELSNGPYNHAKSFSELNEFTFSKLNEILIFSKKYDNSTFIIPVPYKQYNTVFIIRKGVVIAKYKKIHLFNALNEDKIFRNGNSPVHWENKFKKTIIKCGIITCFDLRFPELTRYLALKKIQLLFVPARFPKIRDDHWKTLLKARAIENHIFVIGINSIDNEGGYSYIFNPNGDLIFSNLELPSSASLDCTLELKEIKNSKKLFDTTTLSKLKFKSFNFK